MALVLLAVILICWLLLSGTTLPLPTRSVVAGFGIRSPVIIHFSATARARATTDQRIQHYALFGSAISTPTAIVWSPAKNDTETDAWHKRVIYDSSGSDGNNNNDGNNVDESSPRAWLESHRENGAYTVIRCDYHCTNATTGRPPPPPNKGEYTIWGRDFHLERLRGSYEILCQRPPKSNDDIGPQSVTAMRESIDRASRQTIRLLDGILDATRSDLWRDEQYHSTNRIVMVTILWYPMADTTTTTTTTTTRNALIRVEGHATIGPIVSSDGSSQHPFRSYEPHPITTAIATTTSDYNTDDTLPNRQPYPQAKLSAWCRQRRSLEEAFMKETIVVNVTDGSEKRVDVHEVILTATSHSTSLLLEGLTSNLFVVYPHGVVRTAGTGVLPGFARHLVEQAIREDDGRNGWTLDTSTPILLDEAEQWQEIFVTSAIRLIVPVQTVLVPNETTKRRVFQKAWCLEGKQQTEQVWKLLYDSILTRAYTKF